MTLYHYTDQNGFMGIILKQELWASKIQYLNDDKEYNLAINLAESHLQELIESCNDIALETQLNYYLSICPLIKNTNVCVASLTEKGDQLSQWRGYSRSLGGYSIGFNKLAIEPFIRHQGCELVKCEYEPAKQKQIVSEMISILIGEFSREREDFDHEMNSFYESGNVFLEKLAKIAPTLKDFGFFEEEEWRIISTVNFENLEFRAGKSMLTPYFKISFDCTKNRDFDRLIDEIIVGHTPNPDLAVISTEAFILKLFPPALNDDYRCPIIVKKSSIPFRNW